MFYSVDPAAPEPLFEQLAAGVRAAVLTGDLRAGERLPAARQLAESLDINLHTVLRAYQELRDEGLIDLRRGRGAVVRERTGDYAELSRLIAATVSEARRLGVGPGALSALIRKAHR